MLFLELLRGFWKQLRRAWTRSESDEVAPGEQYTEWERLEGVPSEGDGVPPPDDTPRR